VGATICGAGAPPPPGGLHHRRGAVCPIDGVAAGTSERRGRRMAPGPGKKKSGCPGLVLMRFRSLGHHRLAVDHLNDLGFGFGIKVQKLRRGRGEGRSG